ncbi:MAG: DoxX family protein [Syntrophomonadaceae bacterium]
MASPPMPGDRVAAPRSVLLVRLLVGGVFLAEGIQKFLYPGELGPGRFAKIGIPWPDALAPFVGVVEIVGGALVLAGLATRVAAGLLLADILVAIASTKIPILLGRGYGPFTLASLPRYGFWSMVHEARVDFCMALGSLFLILTGAGPISLDARLREASPPESA